MKGASPGETPALVQLFTLHSSLCTSKVGQRGRICTCDPSVPSRVCWLLHYALMAPLFLRRSVPRQSRNDSMPDYAVEQKMSERAGQRFAGHTPWQRSCGRFTEIRPFQLFTFHSAFCTQMVADPKGLAPSAFPQTTGCSRWLSYGSEMAFHAGLPSVALSPADSSRAQSEGWWEVLVMLQFVASDTYL